MGMQGMARVLIIAYTSFPYDGRVKRHAESLAARGDWVDVIALSSGQEGRQNGVNVIGVPIERYRGSSRTRYVGSYVRFFIRAARVGYQLSRIQPYDVVITCTMPDTAVLSALPARLFGSAVILDIHDTMPELYLDKFGGRRGAVGARLLMVMERVCAGFADRVFAVHQPHRTRLQQAGIPGAKIMVVMNSPQPDIFNRSGGPKAELARCVVVCHGTITRRLGVDCAIEAIGKLVDRIPGIELRLIGAGDFMPQAQRLAARLDVLDHVRFEGLVPIDQLPRVLHDAAIGLVPNHASNATHLMLPVKLMEYAALGIPVVASRLRTLEQYFPPHAVRLVNPGDPAALAAAIEELWRNPQMRGQLARNAYRIARELSWAEQQHQLFAAIDELAGRRGGASRQAAARDQFQSHPEPQVKRYFNRNR